MKFRFFKMSMLAVGLIVTTMVALRAADEKTKTKEVDVPPPPGTIKFSMAPAAVQKTFKIETKDAKVELLGKGKMDPKDGDDKAIYRATVGVGSNDYVFTVAANGQVLEKVLLPTISEVKIEECPVAVQKLLKEEVKGAKVEAIEKRSAGKRADFTMDVIAQTIRYQLVIADDGTLLSKHFDDGTGEGDSAAPKEEEKKQPQPERTAKKPSDKQIK